MAQLKEEAKIALGMLSSRMQRVEKGVTGKNRGPPPLSTDPKLFSVIVPTPPTEKQQQRARQQPEEHPDSLKSGSDLLWREGRPQPPTGPRPRRAQFARFFPSHNKGKPTSGKTLSAIASSRADDVWNRAHAARAPARLAVRLSREVLEMCREHGIDYQALMREGANPLGAEVPQMHGPYTPSWEYAIGDVQEPGFDPEAEAARNHAMQSSARSAPGSSRRLGDQRGRMRESPRKPLSARPTRVRPEAVLDESEVTETRREVQKEMEELSKRRANAMRRRAAVQLEEQRRREHSCELEKQQEQWRESRQEKEQKKQERTSMAKKQHILETEQQRERAREKLREGATEAAEKMQQRWREQERSAEAARLTVLERQGERAETEQRAERQRLEEEERRAAARAQAIAEYEDARVEGEREALARASAFVDEKRQAAETRVQEYEQRRNEASTRKRTAIDEHAREVREQWEHHLDHDAIIEQQQRERMLQPYRNHEKDREREAAAPLEVRRLDRARARRFQSAIGAADGVVRENRELAACRHAAWVVQKREARARVVKRVEEANRDKMARIEEHAAAVKKYEVAVAKHEAKRTIREEIIKQEREAFHQRQSEVMAAVRRSEVQANMMGESQLDAIISGGGKKGGSPRR
jgi:hypothetical protein